MGYSVQPDADTAGLLSELLRMAQSGDLQEVFAVYRFADGDFGSGYMVDDLDEMLFEVRTVAIEARAAGPDEPH